MSSTTKDDKRLRRLCLACGFDPADPRQWSWWCGLSDDARRDLLRLSDVSRGALATLTDLGISAEMVSGRGVAHKATSASRNR